MASPGCAGAPMPPGSPASEAPSSQSSNALLNETGAEPPCVRDRNIERVAPMIVALAGIAVRSKAISPRRKPLGEKYGKEMKRMDKPQRGERMVLVLDKILAFEWRSAAIHASGTMGFSR